jgi:hypothetical protein
MKERDRIRDMFEDFKRISNNMNLDGSVYYKFIDLFEKEENKEDSKQND